MRFNEGIKMKATAKDLRFYSKEILDSVARGEEVVITYRGKPHAKIVPVETKSESKKQLKPLFGIWKDNKNVENVTQFIRESRKGRFNAD